MAKQEININGLQSGANQLTILEGKALEDRYPVKIDISGNIESIKNFLEKRYGSREGKNLQLVDKGLVCVIVDADAMSIDLLLDAQNQFGTEIHAKLEHTKDLLQFHINGNHTFTREAMIKLLKFNKRFFADPLKHEDLLNSYMKLNLTGSTTVRSESDDRGNKDVAFKKEIGSQNIPSSFALEMPIFKGQPVHKFRVDICLDVTNASVSFWFESVELLELTEMLKAEIFAEQLKSCQDFVIIHK